MPRLTIEQIKKLPTRRIISYLKNTRLELNSFTCGCCGEFIWNIYPETRGHSETAYYELKDYIKSVYNVLNCRPDRKKIIDENKQRVLRHKIKSKNGGHQKLSKQKKKITHR